MGDFASSRRVTDESQRVSARGQPVGRQSCPSTYVVGRTRLDRRQQAKLTPPSSAPVLVLPSCPSEPKRRRNINGSRHRVLPTSGEICHDPPLLPNRNPSSKCVHACQLSKLKRGVEPQSCPPPTQVEFLVCPPTRHPWSVTTRTMTACQT